MKSRRTHEVIVGAVVGPLDRPAALVLGRYRGSRLAIVGRTVALSPAHSAELAQVLTAPQGPHPWPAQIRANLFGPPGELVELTRVAPLLVVEVSADAAQLGGSFRHAVRYLRVRPDLGPGDVR